MRINSTVAAVMLFLSAGCSSFKEVNFAAGDFAPVRTIVLKDATDPILIASTEAKRVREYFELGLTHRGYVVRSDGPADATATLTILEYGTEQTSKRDWYLLNLNYVVEATSEWTINITKDGKTIFQKRMEDKETMPIDRLAGRQVSEVLESIPVRQP
jgi:alpha-glucosidase (family GH31 glycosyl hydrolase)